MTDPFMLTEAINSVALSHNEGCDCVACRAASGDQDALIELYAALAQDPTTAENTTTSPSRKEPAE